MRLLFFKIMSNLKTLTISARVHRALSWLHARSASATALLDAPLTRLHAIDLAAASILSAVAFICLLDGVELYGLAIVLIAVAARLAAAPISRFIEAEEKKGGAL